MEINNIGKYIDEIIGIFPLLPREVNIKLI
jgi:hypothetical protein